jgi:5-deoxy-glucuronate isomerase
MTELLVHAAAAPDVDGSILRVTPASAAWRYVGFEVLALAEGVVAERETREREVCVVVVSGAVDVRSEHGEWPELGGRSDPWSGRPDGAYLPPGTRFSLRGAGFGSAAGSGDGSVGRSGDGSVGRSGAGSGDSASEVALCWAPAPEGGAPPRVLRGEGVEVETRGHGAQQRFVRPILMGDQEADSLLVCEVLTPEGHWSSYPPHKHDREDPPHETLLEETYYHRISPARGFGLQRVYTDDRALDETFAFGDRDCVLVPRGYHTVSSPPGYDLYYLNVMAGPTRLWAVSNDQAHEWTLETS